MADGGGGLRGGPKVDPKDPQVRKLVYSMYRGMLDQRHERANGIVEGAPEGNVTADEGVGARLQSIMRQQNELKAGSMNAGGPPPPPPPPPIPGIVPASRLPSEQIPARVPVMSPPAALASAMMKDKKPFTYTPGGLDLSEINAQSQPQQNGSNIDQTTSGFDVGPPVQSRSFRMLQNVLNHQDTADTSSNGMPMKVEVLVGAPAHATQQNAGHHGYSSQINGQRGNVSHTSNIERGSNSQPSGGQKSSAPHPGGGQRSFRIVPIQQSGDDLKIIPKHIGGYKTNNSDTKELSNIFKNQVRVSTENDEARSRGGHFPAKTVVVTQIIEPQGPVHIPNLRQQQKPQQQQPSYYQQPGQYQHRSPYQQPTQFQQPSQYQQPGGTTNAAASEQAVPEPKKYMGGSIPSRSFRMLQAMTDADDVSDDGDPANTSEATSPPDDDKQHAANQIPSPTWKPTDHNTPSSLSPSFTFTGTNDTSSDSGISSTKVSPAYTTTKDSKVYRHVSPKVTLSGPKDHHVVNSALSSAKDSASHFSQCSSPTWKNSQSSKFFPPGNQTPSEQGAVTEDQECNRESPRLMKIIRDESSSPQHSQNIIERRYEGGHIPSRVFRHLQTEYPGSPSEASELQEPKPCTDSKSPSPRYEGAPLQSRIIQSLQNENNTSFDSDTSSSYAELDEYYCNGMAKTASNKETVLKELTSQFDSTGIRKKPKAAPGKVFRYLQAQYDSPEDADKQLEPQKSDDTLQPESEDFHAFGYRGSKVPSPSFRFLQNQYHKQQEQEDVVQEETTVSDAPQYDEEPTPYRGARIPGRTFRSLQENVSAHPSVIKPRK